MNSCVVLNIFQLLECLQGDPKYLYTLITLIYLVKSDAMMENIKKKKVNLLVVVLLVENVYACH